MFPEEDADELLTLARMRREIEAWVVDRNQRQTEIDWQFKTEDARIKLKSLYPQLYVLRGTSVLSLKKT